MTTWVSLLSDIRVDLDDMSGTPKFASALLYLYAKDGIRDYSTWFPKRLDRVHIAFLNGGFALPSDFISDIQVECPVDTFLQKRVHVGGKRYPTQSTPKFYYISGGSLYTSGSTTDVYLTYFATHTIPTSEADATTALSVPSADLELIRLYVVAKAYGQMRAKQSSLDRFKVGTGTRDDNPVAPEVVSLMDDYHQKVAERLSGGYIALQRSDR